MTATGFARLLLLSAIWGGSFLFMRMAAPVVGPSWLIFSRVGLAALFLLMIAIWLKKAMQVRQYWRHYLILGFFNSALPFILFAYAAQTISASLLSILNATAPMWSAAIAAIWLRTPLTWLKAFGLVLGTIGVAVLAGAEAMSLPSGGLLAIGAGLAASVSYGVAANYTRFAPNVDSFSNAHGAMWAATLVMVPLALLSPLPHSVPMFPTGMAMLALGIVCSGMAYLIYFRLVSDYGGVSALTVAFLIPVFGTIWGAIFLGEPVTWATLIGGAMVLLGTAIVTGFSVRGLLRA